VSRVIFYFSRKDASYLSFPAPCSRVIYLHKGKLLSPSMAIQTIW
jgi:hypothetical protein